MVELSGGLTKTAAFQQTICKIEALDHLLRMINGKPDEEVAAAGSALAKSAALKRPSTSSFCCPHG